MTGTVDHAAIAAAHRKYRDELAHAGLLVPLGVAGVYGYSGVFEGIVERFDRFVTRQGEHLGAEVMRFPPLMSRQHYSRTEHLQAFPDLLGSVHSFTGNESDHQVLLDTKAAGGDWSRNLSATEVVMTPAACYPLYPTAAGRLPPDGRLIDLLTYVYRHEPSDDPARMQAFRQREYVRLGTAEQALAHRDLWLMQGRAILEAVGLEVITVVANDPFFGRGGQLMAAAQTEQTLKYELVATIATPLKPTAIASCNCHLDYFGRSFGIQTADGAVAHSACIGFGLERIALALLRAHGSDVQKWPAAVKTALEL